MRSPWMATVKNQFGLSSDIKEHYAYRGVQSLVSKLLSDRATKVYTGYLLLIVLVAIAGPTIAPYDPGESLYGPDDQILRNEPPSLAHPFGTNDIGQDLFSRLLVGTRSTLITGLLGGGLVITIGMSIGVTAGYVGGRVDDVLMRLTDVAYGVPLIPMALVLSAILDLGFYTTVVVVGAVLWRSNARVLRSQVLQIKQRPFILAAKATGSSDRHIILKHILPNIAPMAFLFFASGVGSAILLMAGLIFIGVSSPFIPSWAVIIRNAYASGRMSTALWWSIPPGVLISMTVLSTFMLGRAIETNEDASEQDIWVE